MSYVRLGFPPYFWRLSVSRSLGDPISESVWEKAVDKANGGGPADQKKDLLQSFERDHPRIRTNLTGRYMLSDRREFDCIVTDVALGGIGLTGPENGAIGETVIVYIDQLGRVQGDIVRFVEGGFALKLTVTTRATEKLAARLDNFQAESKLESRPDERRREPQVETDDTVARYTLPLGKGGECEILDLSSFGADVKIRRPPPIGTPVQLGQSRGTVVRHTEHGVAIEFDDTSDRVSDADQFAEIKLPPRLLD